MPIPKYETDEEFDDGGTPDWRARHAIIEPPKAPPRRVILQPALPLPRRSLWQRFWDLPLPTIVMIGYFGPWAFWIGGSLLAVIFYVIRDLVFGTPPLQ